MNDSFISNIVKYKSQPKSEFFFDESIISIEGQPDKYDFSVVIAAYNSDRFISETIESVIEQDYGFENIQLILVNDGSKDNTFEICSAYAKKYPNNIIVIDKENGGVSSARNAGMKYVKGKYINFLDSDDKFEKNVFSKVFEFFEKHETKTDVVTIKVELFGAKTGDTWFNRKFANGDRLLNLWSNPKIYLNAVNSTFFHSRIKNQLFFDENLSISEDLKTVNYILMNKWSIGLLASCKFLYRIHNADEMSLTNSARKKPDWYFPYLERVYFWLYEQSYAKTHQFPKFLQHTLYRDLYNRFVNNTQLESVLKTEEERIRYKELLFKALSLIDDDVICGVDCINKDYQIYFYSIKYGTPEISVEDAQTVFSWKDGEVKISKKCTVMFENCRITNRKLYLEGYCVLNNARAEYRDLHFIVNGQRISPKILKNTIDDSYAFSDERIFKRKHFKVSINLNRIKNSKIEAYVNMGGIEIPFTYAGSCKWFGVNAYVPHAYYKENGYALYFDSNALYVKKAGFASGIKLENAYLKQLKSMRKNNPQATKAYKIRSAYRILKYLKIRPLWLVSDRDVTAGDNGEAFYAYLKKKPFINKYFVFRKSASDAKRLKLRGFKLLDPESSIYKFKYILADAVVSSNLDPSQISPIICSKYLQDIIQKKRYVFLQHGIIKDDLSGVYSRQLRKIDMFVTSTVPEYKSIVENPMYFCDETVTKLTGLPRYDLLYNNDQKNVLVIPTWRRGNVSHIDYTDMQWVLKPGFENTYYYKFYHGLLSNERLQNSLKSAGYKLCYFPHINIIRSNKYFEDIKGIHIIKGKERNYTKIFAEASIMVTDYSSTAFDFGYLRKPMVFCQGDSEEFFSSHTYTKGYFDYRRDAFGEVTENIEEAVDAILRIVERDGKIEGMYLERINKFFPFSDKKNCKRVYTEIKNIIRGDEK